MQEDSDTLDAPVDECNDELEEEDEEECAEADQISKEYDSKAYGIYQQLPVGRGDPEFASGSPQTAEEYLRRVRHALLMIKWCTVVPLGAVALHRHPHVPPCRYEAAQLPEVVTASSLDTSSFEDKRTQYIPAAAAEPELQADVMDQEWLQDFLEHFAALRLVLQR